MSEAKTPSYYPKDFYCPITLELFTKPYIGPIQMTFEYSALVEHFKSKNTHPITHTPCSLEDFGLNHALQNSIESMKDHYEAQGIKVSTSCPNTIKKECDTQVTYTSVISNVDLNTGCCTGLVTLDNNVKTVQNDIVVIIDKSGSMNAYAGLKNADGQLENNGLTLQDICNSSAITILESLSHCDRISVIEYNNNAHLTQPLAFVNAAIKTTLGAKIKKITADGTTNIWGALRDGLEQLRKNYIPGRKQTIILLTDGHPNVRPPHSEEYMVEKWLKQYPELNIDIHTVGFGNHIDSNILTGIATVGGGTYNFLPSPDMIGTIFVNLIANILASSCEMPLIDIKLPDICKFAVPEVPGMTSQVTRISDNHITIQCPRLKCGAPFTIAYEFKSPEKIDNKSVQIAMEGQHKIKICVHTEHGNNEVPFHQARNIFISGLKRLSALLTIGEDKSVIKAEYHNTLEHLKGVNTPDHQTRGNINAIIEDFKGQVREACDLSQNKEHIGRNFWASWGQHWAPSIIMAHLYQYTNNFRDPGIQKYGKTCVLFEVLQEKIDQIFDKLPPPEPREPVAAEFRCMSMVAYNNRSYDGCFDGDCFVRTPTLTNGQNFILVKDLKKGDIVYTTENDTDIVECVMRTRCNRKSVSTTLSSVPPRNTDGSNDWHCADFCALGKGLLITPWHPVKDPTTGWSFPEDISDSKIAKPCEFVYDIILQNRTPTLLVNDIMVATLGHKQKGEVIEHEYFGDRIIKDLQYLDGYKEGLVTIKGFKKNTETGLIDTLIPDESRAEPTIESSMG